MSKKGKRQLLLGIEPESAPPASTVNIRHMYGGLTVFRPFIRRIYIQLAQTHVKSYGYSGFVFRYAVLLYVQFGPTLIILSVRTLLYSNLIRQAHLHANTCRKEPCKLLELSKTA